MYVPHSNAMDDDARMRAFVAEIGAAQLITIGDDGYPAATLLPVVWTGDRAVAHMAKANAHWRAITPGSPALLVCQGHQAYVSPTWYATKADHGRVVPTWNYSAVEIRGTVTVFDDADRLRAAVTTLTDLHEGGRDHPWSVTDAPADYVSGQLRGIVGIEVEVEAVTGKAKLSQNRSSADVAGVIARLRREPSSSARAVADEMEREVPSTRR